ncbi:hypothetical protein AB0I54_11435 [Streptomyces sp. NPDC050625]|uniref:hypothetical protein n=1 Tax=Streptomyces sp. NPDC050625 TaxID=3154629 RepID=UPI003421AAA2
MAIFSKLFPASHRDHGDSSGHGDHERESGHGHGERNRDHEGREDHHKGDHSDHRR